MHYYQFNIGDYLSHTTHLSDEEDLAYRRMLDLYYQSEQPFGKIELVARRVRSTPEIVRAILEEFFVQNEHGFWHNPRADEEIEKYHDKAESARKANQVRWSLKPDADQILTNNQEPITNNHKPIKPIGGKRATQLPAEYKPNEQHIQLANQLGIVIGTEFDKFKDYCTAKGATYKDWDAAFRNWLRNSRQYTRNTPKQAFAEKDYGRSGKL